MNPGCAIFVTTQSSFLGSSSLWGHSFSPPPDRWERRWGVLEEVSRQTRVGSPKTKLFPLRISGRRKERTETRPFLTPTLRPSPTLDRWGGRFVVVGLFLSTPVGVTRGPSTRFRFPKSPEDSVKEEKAGRLEYGMNT